MISLKSITLTGGRTGVTAPPPPPPDGVAPKLNEGPVPPIPGVGAGAGTDAEAIKKINNDIIFFGI